MPISHRLHVLFIHIPKCAGTKIEALLDIPASAAGVAATFMGRFVYKGHTVSMQHLPAEALQSIYGRFIFPNYFKFAFVRNPFDRLVSEYAWQRDHDLTDIASFDQFVDTLARHFDTIQAFNRFERPDALVPGLNPYLFDHFRPQHEFVYASADTQRLLVDFVGRV